MCGIVGLLTMEREAHSGTRRRFMEDALILDALRGFDSTGVYLMGHDTPSGAKAYWAKQVCDGYDFVQGKLWKDIKPHFPTYRFIVGHNRSATIGGVGLKTAHPFQEGPITLVHNGTLDTTWPLPKSMKELDAHNDSHTICHNLAIASPEEVISKLDGAFALVWHDARDNSLNMVRNSKRPLHLAKAADSQTIYFASEGEMLYYIAHRQKIAIEPVVSLKVAHWLKFTGEDLTPEVKEVTLYSPRASRYDDWLSSSGGGVKTVIKGSWKDTIHDAAKPVIADPKVAVLGRRRAVPEQLQEELLSIDLLPEQMENFVPCKGHVVKWGKDTTYVVTGYLETQGVTAAIYGVPINTWEGAGDRVWTVRPLGVKWLDALEPCVICALSGTLDTNRGYRSVTSRMRMAPHAPNKPEEEEEREPIPGQYPGPFNNLVSFSEWQAATCGGCIACTGPLFIEDAEDIEWVNGGRDPMCQNCVKLMLDEGTEDAAPWLH